MSLTKKIVARLQRKFADKAIEVMVARDHKSTSAIDGDTEAGRGLNAAGLYRPSDDFFRASDERLDAAGIQSPTLRVRLKSLAADQRPNQTQIVKFVMKLHSQVDRISPLDGYTAIDVPSPKGPDKTERYLLFDLYAGGQLIKPGVSKVLSAIEAEIADGPQQLNVMVPGSIVGLDAIQLRDSVAALSSGTPEADVTLTPIASFYAQVSRPIATGQNLS